MAVMGFLGWVKARVLVADGYSVPAGNSLTDRLMTDALGLMISADRGICMYQTLFIPWDRCHPSTV